MYITIIWFVIWIDAYHIPVSSTTSHHVHCRVVFPCFSYIYAQIRSIANLPSIGQTRHPWAFAFQRHRRTEARPERYAPFRLLWDEWVPHFPDRRHSIPRQDYRYFRFCLIPMGKDGSKNFYLLINSY